MKILVIGKGGREHALAYACHKSKLCDELYMAPGNPGMAKIGTCVDVSDSDIEGLVSFAKEKQIDQVMINDQLLEEKRDYVVCTSDFLQRGSSYPPLKSNRDVAYRAEMLRNLLEDVIQHENKIKIAKAKRWIYK